MDEVNEFLEAMENFERIKEQEENEKLEEEYGFFKDEIIIDNEISKRLWKLEPKEYDNLSQSIITDGCREPLILWGKILIDGHNRYEICKANNISYKTVQKEFTDKEEALQWIDRNQLSRRNLLDWQRDLLLGRISKTYKLPEGNSQLRQNVSVGNQQTIAEDLGVSTKTLQRNEKFLDAYETIERETNKETADELASKISKQDLIEIAKIPVFEKDEVIEKIKSGAEKLSDVKKELKKEALSKAGSTIIIKNELIDIRHGDFTEVLDDIPDNSLDMILTDPPYPFEYLHCWSELGEFAQKKLKDGGFLIAYSGHIYLPEVIQRVMSSGLNWYWLGACLHGEPGQGKLAQCFEVNMFAKFKPILFLYKGKKKIKQDNWCEDVFINPVNPDESKEHHHWGQGVAVFDKIIKVFEPKVVCDPFLGGGTTAIAALMNNVKCIGAEIDEDSYNVSKKRISEYE